MNTSDIFNLIHSCIESSRLGKRISHKQMADELGISMRTYQEWRLGNSNPKAIDVIFKMFTLLEDEDILRIIHRVKQTKKDAS